MANDRRRYWQVCCMVAVLALFLLLHTCFQRQPYSKPPAADTIYRERIVVVPPDTLTLTKYRPRIVYRDTLVHDTVISTKPFFAYMDTTIGCASVKLRYTFPENTFDSLQFVSCPDTVVVTDTTIVNTVTATSSFWEDAGKVAIGAVGGFLLGIGLAR